VALTAAVVVDLVATASGHFERVAGGECGGRSCVDPGTNKGYAIAFVLTVMLVFVTSWPWMVRRYRQQWSDN
jgi:DMSO/TMAO reductase YedYZ heme-binding membrane subunit